MKNCIYILFFYVFIIPSLVYGQDNYKEKGTYCLAPLSRLTVDFQVKNIVDDSAITRYLEEVGAYSKAELDCVKELNTLAEKAFKENIEPLEVRTMLSTFREKYGMTLAGNLCLYNSIENLYFRYEKDDAFKESLVEILQNIGLVLSLRDLEATGIAQEYMIHRETRKGRLKDTEPLISKHIGDIDSNTVVFDMGASFGTESFSLFQHLADLSTEGLPHVAMLDLNIYQFVVYNTLTKEKIYLNSLRQPGMVRDKEGNIFGADDPIINPKQFYQFQSAPELTNKMEKWGDGNERFFRHGDWVVERVEVAHPQMKVFKKLGFASIIQHDVKSPFLSNMPSPRAVRINNLLQYFELPIQIKILKNILSFIEPNGVILFNQGMITDDSPYLFMIKKLEDGQVELIEPERLIHPKGLDRIRSRVIRAINFEFNDVKRIVQVLNKESGREQKANRGAHNLSGYST